MPRGDGTGPMGMGPMTGRGAGYCAGYAVPGFVNGVMGRRRGRRRMYYATGQPGWMRYNDSQAYEAPDYTEADEIQALRIQADALEKRLGEIGEILKGFENTETVKNSKTSNKDSKKTDRNNKKT